MDLSKAFDYIPQDLLAAKFHAYDLWEGVVTFVHFYLKRRKQGAKINDTENVFQILFLGIPKGSILGPILFNILVNDFIFFINSIQDGGQKAPLSTSFSPVTSTNVGISPQNFPTFSFNPFAAVA